MLKCLWSSKERKEDNNVGKDIKKLESLYTVISVQFIRSIVPDSFWCQTAACQASLSITNPSSLLKLTSIKSVMPSNHFILCCPLLLLLSILPSIKVFSNELPLHIRWPKWWSFSFSIGPSNYYSGLIYFRIDWFDLLAVQRLSKAFSITKVWKHHFFGAQPSLWLYVNFKNSLDDGMEYDAFGF